MAKLETKLRKNKLFGSAELEARYKLYKETERSISDNQLKEVVSLLSAKAQFESKEHHLYHRVATSGESFLYDLANEKGEIIEISADGWRVTNGDKYPFLFKRGSSKAQVKPEPGGDLKELLNLINIKDSDYQMLYLSTLPVRLIRDVDQMIAYINVRLQLPL